MTEQSKCEIEIAQTGAPHACETCSSPNIWEDIRFCRGFRDGTWKEWRNITRRCTNCGAVKVYVEEDE